MSYTKSILEQNKALKKENASLILEVVRLKRDLRINTLSRMLKSTQWSMYFEDGKEKLENYKEELVTLLIERGY